VPDPFAFEDEQPSRVAIREGTLGNGPLRKLVVEQARLHARSVAREGGVF
jgi:hypothetical protein